MEGFYKNDEGSLLFAPNFISAPTYVLIKEEKDNYAYPIEGWYWFSNREEAITTLGIIEIPIDPEIRDDINHPNRLRK